MVICYYHMSPFAWPSVLVALTAFSFYKLPRNFRETSKKLASFPCKIDSILWVLCGFLLLSIACDR